MNARQAAKAAALRIAEIEERIAELEYVNKRQAADIKELHLVIWNMICGESPCPRCEDWEECQLDAKAGNGCSNWWLHFPKDGDSDAEGQTEGQSGDPVQRLEEQ